MIESIQKEKIVAGDVITIDKVKWRKEKGKGEKRVQAKYQNWADHLPEHRNSTRWDRRHGLCNVQKEK